MVLRVVFGWQIQRLRTRPLLCSQLTEAAATRLLTRQNKRLVANASRSLLGRDYWKMGATFGSLVDDATTARDNQPAPSSDESKPNNLHHSLTVTAIYTTISKVPRKSLNRSCLYGNCDEVCKWKRVDWTNTDGERADL